MTSDTDFWTAIDLSVRVWVAGPAVTVVGPPSRVSIGVQDPEAPALSTDVSKAPVAGSRIAALPESTRGT